MNLSREMRDHEFDDIKLLLELKRRIEEMSDYHWMHPWDIRENLCLEEDFFRTIKRTLSIETLSIQEISRRYGRSPMIEGTRSLNYKGGLKWKSNGHAFDEKLVCDRCLGHWTWEMQQGYPTPCPKDAETPRHHGRHLAVPYETKLAILEMDNEGHKLKHVAAHFKLNAETVRGIIRKGAY